MPKEVEHDTVPVYPSWCLGVYALDHSSNNLPDIAMDADTGNMSVINVSTVAKTYFITVTGCETIFLSNGMIAESGLSRGIRNDYVTFIVLVHPRQRVDVCRLCPKVKPGKTMRSSLRSVRISSDIQDFVPASNSTGVVNIDVFPLLANNGDIYVCTQSSGGHLTHFAHTSTYHAVDFRCPVGTPVVAPFDCVVSDIRNDSNNSGVRVEDLFSWNSMMVKSSEHEQVYCEFVHLRKDSMRFKVGDTVKKGDILCESGDVGFCPEPHLHFEMHASSDPGADSIAIHFNNEPFLVGRLYP